MMVVGGAEGRGGEMGCRGLGEVREGRRRC